MIIDADCHISPIRKGNMISYEQLLERMDRSAVDKALTWLQPPYTREIDDSNAYVHEAMRKHPDRILGFGWADPNLGVEKAQDQVKRCVYEYGFFGVKMNGAQNEYDIDDEELSLPVVEEIVKTGKPIAFHCGADHYTRTHPYQIAKIAKRFPELQILALHMGGAGIPDMSKAAIEIAQKYPNVTLVGSAINPESVLAAVKALGAERVCFGSDTPFRLMHVCIAMYNALLNGEVSEEAKANIMGRNIARIFGLNICGENA